MQSYALQYCTLRQPQIRFNNTRNPHKYVYPSSYNDRSYTRDGCLLTHQLRLLLLLLLMMVTGYRVACPLSRLLPWQQDDLKASEALLLSTNLRGLMAPSSCHSCNDGTVSSLKNFRRALQKNICHCCRLYLINSTALDIKM